MLYFTIWPEVFFIGRFLTKNSSPLIDIGLSSWPMSSWVSFGSFVFQGVGQFHVNCWLFKRGFVFFPLYPLMSVGSVVLINSQALTGATFLDCGSVAPSVLLPPCRLWSELSVHFYSSSGSWGDFFFSTLTTEIGFHQYPKGGNNFFHSLGVSR